jgi:hypothetical protein
MTSLPHDKVPLIHVPLESAATREMMEYIVIAWPAAMARIMVRGKITEYEAAVIDRHVKIFLTTVDSCDASIRRKRKTADGNEAG